MFRFPKQIEARDADFPEVPTVVKVTANSQAEWHQEVLAFLHSLRDEGHLTDWNQVAFLFRSVRGDKAVALARFLERNGISVYSPRSNQFFGREEIQLMIGALIFLFPQFAQVRQWDEDARLGIWGYYDQDCFGRFSETLRQPENRDLLNWGRRMAKTPSEYGNQR